MPDEDWQVSSLAAARSEPPPKRWPRLDSTRFSHQKHKDLACKSCHGSDRSHGELLVQNRDDCAACHHGPAQKATCRDCHDGRQLGKQLALAVPVKTTVSTSATSRVLPFKHEQHARSECATCHEKRPSLEFQRGCASCHSDHHVAARDCKTCHATTPATASHSRERVHQGCGGSGCHQDASVTALPASRNVCLACHAKQADHKTGRDCAACHRVDWTASSGLEAGGKPQ